jgi:hypothetical protein
MVRPGRSVTSTLSGDCRHGVASHTEGNMHDFYLIAESKKVKKGDMLPNISRKNLRRVSVTLTGEIYI